MAVELAADEAHHFRHVLRLGANAEIEVFNGLGHQWTARVRPFRKRGPIVCDVTAMATAAAEPHVFVTLAIGALKGDQMDTVVRDTTMLGVQTIVPIVSEHVATSRRAAHKEQARERWHRIAVASAKQCGRAFVPVIMPALRFVALFDAFDADAVLMCVEPALPADATTELAVVPRPKRALAFIGPEGGWSKAELDFARQRNARLIHLGPRTLRAETAPTVLLSALWTVWGW